MAYFFEKLLRQIKVYNQIAEIDEIARRYFALNSFDGILTTLGIIAANFFAGITSSVIVITGCVGAATAVTVSGFYGAFITESSEREGKLKSLEKRIGINLKKTQIEHAHNFATLVLAFIEGVVPFLIAISIMMPFFFAEEIKTAYYMSSIIAVFFLFVIGAFLGNISKRNIALSGIKMIFAGVMCTFILFLVEHFFGI
jgi:predicted membrane protein (TIGR00267 family)